MISGPPTITNDDVTIAREIQLRNVPSPATPLVFIATSLTSCAPMVTNGTTATVLAQALVREGLRAVDGGANPMQLRRGIEEAVAVIVKPLHERTAEVGGAGEPAVVEARSAPAREGAGADRERARPGQPQAPDRAVGRPGRRHPRRRASS